MKKQTPPTGTVTFLFTDIEGSTKLWEEHRDAMKAAVARHDVLLRDAIGKNRGYVFKTVGDAFCAAFPTAPNALGAALTAQRAQHAEPWGEVRIKVRMALHTGVADERDHDYFGRPLNRVARLLAAGHGGQTLLSAATQELVRDLLPSNVYLRDLGEHRLRDLDRPEHVFQLVAPDLPSDFPSLRTLDIFPNNLPIQLTSFIGREKEIEEVKRLLFSSRLLTLTGAGGTGKSRLLLQVAADLLERFPNGVWLVELASVSNPTLITQTVAAALGVREEPGLPLLTTLTDYLHTKNLLLLMDNCERLIHDAAKLVDALLRVCPNLYILATSREALKVPGEIIFRVPSLSMPDSRVLASISDRVSNLTRYEAVRLFIDRARFASPGFTMTDQNARAVGQICQRLEGIPLAIELAAPRVKTLSVSQITARLDDVFRLLTNGSRTAPPRQRTLLALIEWSYDLLSDAERMLMRRLSVFVGGWALEAAEQICGGDGIEKIQVFDLLANLIDKSLVVADAHDPEAEARYRFLEPIRQYAYVRLVEAGEENDATRRHRDWFLRLAEEALPKLHGAEQMNWLNRLEVEYENILAAMHWSLAAGDTDAGLRFAASLWWFWNVRGYWSEGREWLTEILALPGATPRTSGRAKALYVAGYLARLQGDYAVARSLFEDSLGLSQELRYMDGIAFSLLGLGALAQSQGDDTRARSLYEEASSYFHEIGDRWGEASAVLNLGILSVNQGNLTEARSHYESSLATFRHVGDIQSIAKVLGNLGLVNYHQGDYAAARPLFEESLMIRRELRDKSGIAYQLDNLGYIALHQGDYEKARALFEESLIVFNEIKSKRMIVDVLYGFAGLAVVQGDPKQAARLFGAGEVIFESLGAKAELSNQQEYDRNVAATRAQLEDAAFKAAWAGGRAMTMEQAIAFALAKPSQQ